MIFVNDTVTLSWVLPPKPTGVIPVIGDFSIRVEGPYLQATQTVSPTTYTAPTTSAEGEVTYDFTPTQGGTYRVKMALNLVAAGDEQPFNLWNEEILQVIEMPQNPSDHPTNPNAFITAPYPKSSGGVSAPPEGIMVELPTPLLLAEPLQVILRDIVGFSTGPQGSFGHPNGSNVVIESDIVGYTCDLPPEFIGLCGLGYLEVLGGTPPYTYSWTSFPPILMGESSDLVCLGLGKPDIQAYRYVDQNNPMIMGDNEAFVAGGFRRGSWPCMDSETGGGAQYIIGVTVTDADGSQSSDTAQWEFESF